MSQFVREQDDDIDCKLSQVSIVLLFVVVVIQVLGTTKLMLVAYEIFDQVSRLN